MRWRGGPWGGLRGDWQSGCRREGARGGCAWGRARGGRGTRCGEGFRGITWRLCAGERAGRRGRSGSRGRGCPRRGSWGRWCRGGGGGGARGREHFVYRTGSVMGWGMCQHQHASVDTFPIPSRTRVKTFLEDSTRVRQPPCTSQSKLRQWTIGIRHGPRRPPVSRVVGGMREDAVQSEPAWLGSMPMAELRHVFMKKWLSGVLSGVVRAAAANRGFR